MWVRTPPASEALHWPAVHSLRGERNALSAGSIRSTGLRRRLAGRLAVDARQVAEGGAQRAVAHGGPRRVQARGPRRVQGKCVPELIRMKIGPDGGGQPPDGLVVRPPVVG